MRLSFIAAVALAAAAMFNAPASAQPCDPVCGIICMSQALCPQTDGNAEGMVAVSLEGNAHGAVAVSGTRNARGDLAGLSVLAMTPGNGNGGLVGLAGNGNADGGSIAVSGTGNADGGVVAVAPLGHASGPVGAGGCDLDVPC